MRDELTDDDFEEYELEEEEDEFESFDCHMTLDKRGRPLGCGKAGSEECDFECPWRRQFSW
jgi:hypothetical protein